MILPSEFYEKDIKILFSLSKGSLSELEIDHTRELLRGVSWDRLNTLMLQSNLSPLIVYNLLQYFKEISIPQDLLSQFQKIKATAIHRWILYDQTLFTICNLIKKNGFSFLLLKGSALANVYYPEPWTRASADIDILIPKEQYHALEGVIQSLGWERMLTPHRPISEKIYYSRLFRPSQRSDLFLDVHISLSHPFRYHIPEQEIFKGAERPSKGFPFLIPCPEDLILHICIHHVIHHIIGTNKIDFRTLIDLQEIIRQREIRWEILINKAKRWGGRKACYLSLLILREIAKVQIPAYVLKRLKPASSSWLDTWRCPNLFQQGFPLSWRRKISLLFGLADYILDSICFLGYYTSLRLADLLAIYTSKILR